MAKSKLQKNHNRRLTVEGINDAFTIIELLARHGADFDKPDRDLPYVSFEPSGVEAALEAIQPAVKTFDRFGVVIDRDLPDHDSGNRWLQARDRLRRAGLVIPDDMPSDGLVVDGVRPGGSRVGLWLMPDNLAHGTLEHFLESLVPNDDSVFPIAGRATDEALSAGAPLSPRDRLKGVLHAWLAWQDPPGAAFGAGIKARAFRADSATALAFVAWFRRLYDAP